ncbi:unnamed protein product [Pocillopora meandrina]|uniref:DUF4536 domain-containing protein n=1 Tax=Pocillopora meandrina TaxID=46732 RepID=A0AAU9WWK8_9CNID|nr:unnamed protein product [Pocillopora meandrina]
MTRIHAGVHNMFNEAYKMASSSNSEDNRKLPPLEKLPDVVEEPKPVYKEENTNDSWSALVRKLDIEFNEDCVSCKFIGASVCYVCGYIALNTVKTIPASNMPAKVMTGLFGVGLFGIGTLRLFKSPAELAIDRPSNKSSGKDSWW